MPHDEIHSFIATLQDASGFESAATRTALATPALFNARAQRQVEGWVATAVEALRDAMREDLQPPVAQGVLHVPGAVLGMEAEPCEQTSWFVNRMHRTAAALPEVWVAVAVPDTSPHVPISAWNPANSGWVDVTAMRYFVEVRGQGLGLPRGMLVRTGRTPLQEGPVDLAPVTDEALRRMGRRILHRHPVRSR